MSLGKLPLGWCSQLRYEPHVNHASLRQATTKSVEILKYLSSPANEGATTILHLEIELHVSTCIWL